MNRIRRATTDDALRIAEISIETWNSAYDKILPHDLLKNRKVDEKRINSWKECITNKNYIVLVCENEDICGYLWGGPQRDNIDIPFEIYAIYVSPKYQKSGIGKALVNEYKNIIRNQPFYLYMLKGNNSADAFYKKLGGLKQQQYNRVLSVENYNIEEEFYIFK